MPDVPSRSSLPACALLAVLSIPAIAGGSRAMASEVGADAGIAPDSGVRIIEGDVLVRSHADASLGFRGVGPGGAGLRWPHGEVPYRIDGTLSPASARAVEAAAARWNAVAGVTLVAVDPGSPVPADHLVFQSGAGCASWVGRQGGAQAVWIGESCTVGSVMHEIGHALGLEHEHIRPDRDRHVRVLWENVLPGKRHNFELAPRGALVFGDYDIDSIMHYGPANFSIDGGPTLESLDPAAVGRLGQRVSPSPGDIAAVARLYASDLALDLRVDAVAGGDPDARDVTLFVTNEHAQGAHDVHVTLAANGVVAPFRLDGSSAPDWRCEAADDPDGAASVRREQAVAAASRVTCRLPRLDGAASSRLVLALEALVTEATLSARVDAKTPDLDRTNNGGATDDLAPALGQALSAAAFADVLVVADDAAGTRAGDASGGAAFGWLWIGALASILRSRRGRYCAGGGSPP